MASDEIVLEWDIFQIANTPEIDIGLNNESSLKYIADTQQLIIPYRNGVNSLGRNPKEDLLSK